MTIGELLHQWLATYKRDVFTHGIACGSLKHARGGTELSNVEKRTLSAELEELVLIGKLLREGDGRVKRNYRIVRAVAEPPRRTVADKRADLAAFLQAWHNIVLAFEYKMLRGGKRSVDIRSVVDRTRTLTRGQPVDLREIHFDLLNCAWFGLFHMEGDLLCWRESAEWILSEDPTWLAEYVTSHADSERKSAKASDRPVRHRD